MILKTVRVLPLRILGVLMFASLYFQLTAQLNITLRSHLSYPEELSDIWGYQAKDGTEYALVGLYSGVSIVSLQDPDAPRELFYIQGANSQWRDIKTWKDFAYVTNETGDGLMVIDLRQLPDTVLFDNWAPAIPDLGTLSSCHNLYIDEFGKCYLAGCNLNRGGNLIIDVNTNPGQPAYLGRTQSVYSHDSYVRSNRLYSSDLNSGLNIYDVSNPATPAFLGNTQTPFRFTHNAWLSDDGKIAFTTDERGNAPVAAYDISDPSNIKYLDEFRPAASLGTGVIPHNVHVKDDYLVISYYTDGCVVVDASRPENLVEIGNYDTWQSNTTGFHGAWGAYPFLPSGLILVSDIESGLYVLEPKYQRAAYLEGTVRDSVNGNPLTGVSVAIIAEQTNTASSGLNGIYKTGLGTPGTFTVIFSKPGYINKLISGVVLESGVVRQLDVQLKPQATGRLRGIIVDDANGIPIPEVKLQIANREFTYDLQSNANGQFIFPDVFLGEYQLYAGAWGYENIAIETVRINEGDQSINIRLKAGYADDFAVDLGWTTAAAGATSGFWVRDIPIGTRFGSQFANPLLDLPDDIGDLCFMTGNGGGDAGTDDVDNGLVTLTSPPMDWSSYDTASFSLQYWLFNGGGSGIPNDTLKIFISNGADTLQLANIAQIHVSDWQLFDSGELSDRIAFTENMQLIVEAGDVLPNGHIVEAAIDAFRVQGGTLVSSVQDIAAAAPDWLLAPNPFSSSTSLRLSPEWSAAGPVTLRVMDALGRPLMQRTLDGSDNQFELGGQLVPGVYWVSLEAGRLRSVKRIVKQ